MFEQSTLAATARTRRVWTVGISFVGQLAGIGVAVLLPLVFTDTLPWAQTARPHLGAPPPPGPPKTASLKHVKIVKVVRESAPPARGLVAPRRIPSTVATVDDPPPVAEVTGAYVVGGIGEPAAGNGGAGVIGSILSGLQSLPGPPAPVPAVRKAPEPSRTIDRIKVGGEVQAAKLIRKVLPVYPALAIQARISGTVRLQAVITADGRIGNLEVISGHPLLVPAAIAAVRQWVYAPTLLNGDPVEVLTVIDVHFTLGR